MNQEIKQEWIAALRSGEYKQATGLLNNCEGMCCLGVLCDLYAKKHSEVEWVFKQPEEYTGKLNGDLGTLFNEELSLPKEVMEWAGLSERNPSTPISQDAEEAFPEAEHVWAHTLAELNDGGLTFPQMADVIERFI